MLQANTATNAAPSHAQWIHRCAQRIQQRHLLARTEAILLAREMYQSMRGMACPERLADNLFADRNATSFV